MEERVTPCPETGENESASKFMLEKRAAGLLLSGIQTKPCHTHLIKTSVRENTFAMSVFSCCPAERSKILIINQDLFLDAAAHFILKCPDNCLFYYSHDSFNAARTNQSRIVIEPPCYIF